MMGCYCYHHTVLNFMKTQETKIISITYFAYYAHSVSYPLCLIRIIAKLSKRVCLEKYFNKNATRYF